MSWIIAGLGIWSMWLTGSRRVSGWWLALFQQVLWVGYALSTQEYGFIIGAVVFGMVCVRNIYQWTHQ